MSFPLRLSPFDKGSNTEHRRCHRRAVGFRARLRTVGITQFDVDLVDLSVAGFRTETGLILAPGSTVWLTMPGLAALEAVVAWRDRYRYGCSFRTPLHQAVLEHIVARNWSATGARG